jgi:hypothetical protein
MQNLTGSHRCRVHDAFGQVLGTRLRWLLPHILAIIVVVAATLLNLLDRYRLALVRLVLVQVDVVHIARRRILTGHHVIFRLLLLLVLLQLLLLVLFELLQLLQLGVIVATGAIRRRTRDYGRRVSGIDDGLRPGILDGIYRWIRRVEQRTGR